MAPFLQNALRLFGVDARDKRGHDEPMSMPNEVIQIAVIGQYNLAVRFQDGASGVHDCAALVREEGPMVDPLRDPSYFADVRLEYGAPTWPNGYDMCPDWLRMEMKAAGELSEPLAAE